MAVLSSWRFHPALLLPSIKLLLVAGFFKFFRSSIQCVTDIATGKENQHPHPLCCPQILAYVFIIIWKVQFELKIESMNYTLGFQKQIQINKMESYQGKGSIFTFSSKLIFPEIPHHIILNISSLTISYKFIQF